MTANVAKILLYDSVRVSKNNPTKMRQQANAITNNLLSHFSKYILLKRTII